MEISSVESVLTNEVSAKIIRFNTVHVCFWIVIFAEPMTYQDGPNESHLLALKRLTRRDTNCYICSVLTLY